LGAYVNGRKIDPQNDPDYGNELKAQAKQTNIEGGQHEPVMVSHPDPERAELAKRIIEAGNEGPMMEYAQKSEAAHPLNLRIPNGITDNLHQALGNLRTWVENPYENGELRPYYNRYHRQLRPALNQRAGAAQSASEYRTLKWAKS
jgi:hypothetical protein